MKITENIGNGENVYVEYEIDTHTLIIKRCDDERIELSRFAFIRFANIISKHL